METRRKEVGRKIKHERRRAGFRSQEAFAAAIGKHETSVGNAERGSDRVGDGVYNAIEDGLGWPLGSIEAYLAGSDSAPWMLLADPRPPTTPEWRWPTDDEIIAMTVAEIREFSFKIQDASGPIAAEDWLFHALGVRRDARRKTPIVQPSEA